MKWLSVVLSLFVTAQVYANETINARQLLKDMSLAVQERNFDASFVVVKGKGMEPYRWIHGQVEQTDLEILTLLNGAGLEVVRVDDVVTYFEPQTDPYSVNTDAIAGPIPEVLLRNIDALNESYEFVLGGKERIAGRPAQLVRLVAKDENKYNYWLWVDLQSALLLKAAYVNQRSEVLEQLQLTHISVTEQPANQLLELHERTFPKPAPSKELKAQAKQQNNWQIAWLPKGFKLLKSDRHKLDLNNELADYFLFSDGLVEVSVFVQRPLTGQRASGALTSGATTVYVHNAGAYDVSVVGKVPVDTAKSIAESVKRAL
ncbi:MucB/RseB C-terminal domain-containing protein [Pseudoalteromonas luteoviolacea]|uniref:Metal ABC transporter ATPase n=1 Tax=Pseudoalteromonas luteoviolacea DSM 6061 TaxID=1365250 RepID=A0A166WQV0_9GAMM|nr:MucB/RseB C-terminal domain-containing protein [Pseudoalteromonas luteoviolacea]KZN37768.1 metal ABC transporter ATPase [Pseudoalteromonas luteoviolacea DSM 6061]KZN60641.1 metal ABC transporter ATPase [Pseudoalteromonas luteoviolacea CPMOR-2]MBE0386806.1 sigma-E factor negative regulatory protein RseB [Pseudoalteromonas luteoviolacea DSM 6061]TQF71634.1 anti-sigma E factor [Pseudoalteromonas luteoviolacea]